MRDTGVHRALGGEDVDSSLSVPKPHLLSSYWVQPLWAQW